MKNALTLTEKETFFIQENRQDPITGDEFCIGDKIVFCASCKSAFLKESWEYMDSKHCGQTFTLKRFPVHSKLTLSKPIVFSFKKEILFRKKISIDLPTLWILIHYCLSKINGYLFNN